MELGSVMTVQHMYTDGTTHIITGILCDKQSDPVYYKILINPMTAPQFENIDFW